MLGFTAKSVYNAGGRPQRVLWASTGTKDPNAAECCTSDRWPRSVLNTGPRVSEGDGSDMGPIDGQMLRPRRAPKRARAVAAVVSTSSVAGQIQADVRSRS